MKVILTKGLAVGWIFLAILIIGLAVVISTARITLPMISDYRGNIETQVSQILKRPVSIGEIGVSWDRLRPVLQLQDITVRDQADTRDSFHFRELQLSFQILRSLKQLKLLPHSIYLSGSELGITRTMDGAFVLRGLSGMTPTGNVTVGERLEAFKNLAINLRDVRLVWHDQPLQQNWEFKTDELAVWFWQGGLSLRGKLQLPEELGNNIDLSAVVRGDLDDYRLWEGNFYVRTDSARLAMFPTLWHDDWPRIEEGLASTETWGSWKGIDDLELTGSLSVLDLRLVAARNENSDADVMLLPQWSGNYRWIQKGKNWHVDTNDMEVVTDSRHWPGRGFSFDFKRRHGEPGQLRGDLDFLDLKTVSSLVSSIPLLPANARDLVKTLNPGGEASRLKFSVTTHTNKPRFLVNGDFSELNWHQTAKLPGIVGLNVSLSANEQGGFAEVRGPGLSFEFDRLFESPLNVDDLQTDLSWESSASGWTLYGDQLSLVNEDLTAFGTLKLDFPGNNEKPQMFLDVAIPELEVDTVKSYLPYGIIPEKTAKWLRNGFIRGKAKNGRVSYAGDLKKHALKYDDVEFKADLELEDAELHYRDNWPHAEKLNGQLSFRNASFSGEVKSGEIKGASVRVKSLGIKDFYKSRFLMDATAKGKAPQYLEFLKDSPLSKGGLREFLETVESQGNTGLALKLDVPLSRKISDPMRVNGLVSLNNAQLGLPEHDIEFSEVKGELSFTAEEFRAEDIKGIFREHPVNATVATGKDREILIDVAGEFSLGQVLPDLDAPWMRLAPGQTEINARVTIPRTKGEQQLPRLDITSDLRGMAIQLPGELGKTASDNRDFKMSWELGTSIPTVDISYNQQVDIRALVNTENKRFDIERAEVMVGGAQAKLEGQGIGIRGQLTELVLEQWAAVIDRLSQEGEGEPLDLRELEFDVANLKAFGQSFKNVNLYASNFDGAWHIALQGEEISGDILWPDNWKTGAPLEATLDHLVVRRDDETATGTQAADDDTLRPEVMPSLIADITNLRWGSADFDRAVINAVRSDEDWLIQKARFESDVMTLQAAGGWLGNSGGTPSTRMQFKMEGRNMGSALSQLEFSTGLGDGQGIIQGDVTWVGAPFSAHFPSLNGEANVDLRNGTLKEVEPGLGRLLALVNLDNLPKRLTLNFKDVALEGLQYDSISGTGRFEDGVLFIDGLGVDSTSAAVSLFGRTYLPERRFDLSLNVVPKFKSAVPLAAGVFIAPQAGFLVYFLDKLVESMGVDINESALLEYKITGDWDSPNVERSSATVEEVRENPLFAE